MNSIEKAVALLRAGELVAFPTETVYGLGADASNPAALAKIFAVKGRPADHPLIVHIASADQMGKWAREIPVTAQILAKAFWPGPLTLILKRQHSEVSQVPDLVTGGQDTVGLRVPGHPLTQQLLQAFCGAGGGGIAAPSANRFGRISPTTAQHVHEELGDRVALVLDGGPCEVGIESTIIDLSRDEPVILRPGMISVAQIEQVLQQHVDDVAGQGESALTAPRVSGSLDSHYAPATAMHLIPPDRLQAELDKRSSQRIAVLSPQPCPHARQSLVWQQAPDRPAAYARDLYANLRMLDSSGANAILVEAPPEKTEWLAIRDRLGRAAHKTDAAPA